MADIQAQIDRKRTQLYVRNKKFDSKSFFQAVKILMTTTMTSMNENYQAMLMVLTVRRLVSEVAWLSSWIATFETAISRMKRE